MLPIRSLFLVALFASWTAANPINEIYKLRLERGDSELDVRQQALTGPVTFQTVTTTQTQAGTIIQTCTITLTPETAQNGSQIVQEDKQCAFQVNNGNGSSPPSNGNGGGNNSSQTTVAVSSSTPTATQIQDTSPVSISTISSGATATGAPPISAIGVSSIPASQVDTITASVPQPVATASGSADPALSVIGTSQVSNNATGTPSPVSPSGTTPVTILTTLSDGSVSTSVSIPSSAQEAAATTPGRKLEVLPIGLGVFAGVSVIALIVVGLVTYERTKYRKAFRQRKLAEAGANMGYGGMAERT